MRLDVCASSLVVCLCARAPPSVMTGGPSDAVTSGGHDNKELQAALCISVSSGVFECLYEQQ